jgi:hypothetical protein
MTASRRRAAGPGGEVFERTARSAGAGRLDARPASAPGGPEVSIEIGEGSIEQFATGDDDEVDGDARLMVQPPEHFSNQSFRTISPNSVSKLPGGDDPEPGCGRGTRGEQEREVARRHPVGRIEDLLELFTSSYALPSGEPVRRHPASQAYELETVRRLRPFARRRFSTSRPFFVAIRVRKPCVFLRRRRLGWKVRFMMSDPCTARNHCGENLNTTGAPAAVSTKRYSPGACLEGEKPCATVPLPARSVGSPPEVFHSCGKNCGKA